jgi:hypothetical protein
MESSKRLEVMDKIISLVSVATALAAIVVGAIVQVYVTNRQIRASTVSNFRQAWINALRDEIAIYIGEWTKVATRWQRLKDESELTRQEGLRNLARHEAKIALLINPNEADHLELLRLIARATQLADEEFSGVEAKDIAETLSQTREKIIAKSQVILKREWNVVKSTR